MPRPPSVLIIGLSLILTHSSLSLGLPTVQPCMVPCSYAFAIDPYPSDASTCLGPMRLCSPPALSGQYRVSLSCVDTLPLSYLLLLASSLVSAMPVRHLLLLLRIRCPLSPRVLLPSELCRPSYPLGTRPATTMHLCSDEYNFSLPVAVVIPGACEDLREEREREEWH